jgi:hypothetical protein
MIEKELKIVELKGCTANAMQLILNCIYTDKVEFTTDNVQELIVAASLFQLPGRLCQIKFLLFLFICLVLQDITEGCVEYLQNQMDPTNCMEFKKFAELHGCVALKNFAQEYIFENFSQVVHSDGFFSLSFEEVEELIKLDEIEVNLLNQFEV